MNSGSRIQEVVYPDSDGKPMADNTRQFRYIATLKGGFDHYYRDRDDIFIAGDLLWYPVEGDNKTRYAPDVLIAFGRPPGDRGSYMRWRENGQPPNVVFEVLSPNNRPKEMAAKLAAYDRFGVDEYYIYDPDRGTLEGWIRPDPGPKGERPPLVQIEQMEGWRSPLTDVTFRLDGNDLIVTEPGGDIFLSYDQLGADRDRQRAAAEQQRSRADESEVRTAALEARLRELGVDPDDV